MASYSWLQKKFELDEREAAAVEWQYEFCGDFYIGLWRTMASADQGNLLLLSLGFPIYVDSFKLYSRDFDWWPNIQKKIPRNKSDIADGK